MRYDTGSPDPISPPPIHHDYRLMAALVIEKSADENQLGRVHELLETPLPETIGRDATNSIPLQDDRASRFHGAVYLRFGEWVVEDRDSRNGILHRGEKIRGEKIKRSSLADGDVFVIGSTHFRFFEDRQTKPLDGKESFGCQLESQIDAGGGVLKYTAWQLAMDRRVRLDLLHPRCHTLRDGRPVAEVYRSGMTDAVEAASRIVHPGVAPVLSAAVPDSQGGVTVMSRIPGTGRLSAELETVRSWSLRRRLALVEKLALAVFARGRTATLRFPMGVTDIWLDPDSGEPTILALEFHAVLALTLGWAAHSPALVPYLAPEHIQRQKKNGRSEPLATLPSLIYNLGALGYHILSGQSPLGGFGEEIIRKRFREPPADLADLVPDLPAVVGELTASMLARDPSARPDRAVDIVTTLREAREGLPDDSRATAVVARPSAGRPPATAARPAKLRQERSERLAAVRARQSAPWWLILPLWVAIWVAVFFGARMGTVYFLKEFGNN